MERDFSIDKNEVAVIHHEQYYDLLHSYNLHSVTLCENRFVISWHLVASTSGNLPTVIDFVFLNPDYLEVSLKSWKNIYNGYFVKLSNVGFVPKDCRQFDYFFTSEEDIDSTSHLVWCFEDEEMIRVHAESCTLETRES